MTIPSPPQEQFRTGPWTFLHDRRVVETFFEGTSGSTRFHVDHFRIDGCRAGGDLDLTWGIEVGGRIVNGGRATVPAGQVGEFDGFVQALIASRTAPQL